MIEPAVFNSLPKQMKLFYFWEIQNKKCYYCDVILFDGFKFVPCNLDHKIAVSKGGRDTIDNLCLSCIECNNTKGSIGEVEFASALAMLKSGKIEKKDIKNYASYIELKNKFGNLSEKTIN